MKHLVLILDKKTEEKRKTWNWWLTTESPTCEEDFNDDDDARHHGFFVLFLLTSRLILVVWMKKPTSGAKQENRSFTAYLDETKISIIIKFLPGTLFPVSFRNNARCSFFALVPLGSSFARRSHRAWKTLFPMCSRRALLSISPISSVKTGNTGDSGYPTAGLP